MEKVDLGWLANINWISLVVIFIGVIGIIALLGYMANKGLIAWNGKLRVGSMDLERNIVRLQLTYLEAAVEEFYQEIERKSTWNEWKSKCVAHACKDVLERAISYNHITTDDSYVLIKQKEVWSAIQSLEMEHKYYKSEEFKKIIYGWVFKVIKDLLDIRLSQMKKEK